MAVLAQRIRQARLAASMSQVDLALAAGIEPETASSRMSRYESGLRIPDPDLVERMAVVLRRPPSWFYEPDERLADLILTAGKLRSPERRKLLAVAEELACR
ncbi:helix-turn-helix domain-containing protein [Ralstonia pseudosolanacearum]|uniref:helix-turn-helix domain-containing protein n=1 Tax=Ralstonia pseudosolanacearum TaxID=1310165 RepID=UPI002676D1E9|nr:helix-turn-helix transcriptional regulator [Ralstonia pseudosolanacearum]MDO3527517.1 helix-turn-helix transcriptional regulator [Ralstonia pseudosolanacearum]MDO3531596.1 helix-turn-helix transcriptional regulator [Ralstonia pseudosolanacearum]